jgi:hypothetical protein
MLQPDPHITLALSQFFQNDDPGLAWAHACQFATLLASEPHPCPEASTIVPPDTSAEPGTARSCAG